MADAHVSPVSRRHRGEAIRFLVGGRRADQDALARAERMTVTVESYPDRDVRLWWARRWGRCRAAALILTGAGRTGILFFSPPGASGVEADALVALVSRLTDDAAEDLNFVQSMAVPGDAPAEAVLAQCGYHLLAELVYLKRDLAPPIEEGDAGLTWRCYGQYAREELERVIAATYEGSLDCPELCGVRGMADVLAAHKCSGLYRPEWWWIAYRGERPVGCLLMNDSAFSDSTEVVYLGVVSGSRGRGYGRAMIEHAAATARAASRSSVTLAVDSRNAPAVRIYDQAGFEEVSRRRAFVKYRTARRK